jgi:hypothetical protein
MSAREKIENLTNSWYGFALFGGLFSFLQGGIGLFSALGAMGSTLVSLLVYAAASVHMNFKSLRVLTDAQVKSYVG